MKTHRIAAIPGDGIGPEVIGAGLDVLAALARRDGGFALDVTSFDYGSAHYRRHGVMMPDGALERLKTFDALYFGAVGAPDIPDHVTLWGLRLAICQGFDQYANVRPTRVLRGLASPLRHCAPADLDWVIVRENSEGEYAGQGGRSHRGHAEEVATEVAIFTRAGVARIMRFAFALAASRPRRHLTVVTKSNAQRHGMVLWDEVAAATARDFPTVTWDRMLVDAMTVRGSAFDITGKGIANPVGAFWTAAQMLEHLGEADAARRLMAAVERVTEAGIRTRDLGGTATTAAVTAAVIAAIEGGNA
ncbi:MAG: tartrate dehydrogenase [Acidiphilium sp. 21-68-69]|nr:MAG: tartrate dehydrogenase [Acidiphilium sp. 21-68-69]